MINDPPGMNRPDWITMEAYLKRLYDSFGADLKITLDGESVAVTGPLTDAQLRNTDVKVTLDSESVAVTGPLTDTQLRATAVPVSGPLTDTQLRASDVNISLNGEEVVTNLYLFEVQAVGNGIALNLSLDWYEHTDIV